jgi:hypothetical protein
LTPMIEVECTPCVVCKTVKTFTLVRSDVDRWKRGEHIQNVFPYLTSMERETLISGVCSQECWDELWGPDEDE